MIGEPSKDLMESMGKEEKARIAEQQKTLGENGLKKMADKLEQAAEENEVCVSWSCKLKNKTVTG